MTRLLVAEFDVGRSVLWYLIILIMALSELAKNSKNSNTGGDVTQDAPVKNLRVFIFFKNLPH